VLHGGASECGEVRHHPRRAVLRPGIEWAEPQLRRAGQAGDDDTWPHPPVLTSVHFAVRRSPAAGARTRSANAAWPAWASLDSHQGSTAGERLRFHPHREPGLGGPRHGQANRPLHVEKGWKGSTEHATSRAGITASGARWRDDPTPAPPRDHGSATMNRPGSNLEHDARRMHLALVGEGPLAEGCSGIWGPPRAGDQVAAASKPPWTRPGPAAGP